ncbi:MAG TPA: TIGR03546 family protein [Lacipirellulaceae bacterium]|nr:TIGR03546 family protein [Lacipirellulaceae bacterium]HMP05201.1 TIGR03546 family protein [Lacipirellulaceae bacterium]
MFTLLFRPLRLLAQAFAANESPRQVAWGVALGMFVGLLPKGSPLAWLLATLVCALRVNRSAALVSAAAFSYVGWLLDDFAHAAGALALTWPPLQHTWTALYELPLGPWIGWNNTVVMGQLLIGCYLLYPVYALAHMGSRRFQSPLTAWLLRRRVIRWLRGAELGSQWGLDG